MLNILMVGPKRSGKGGIATVINNYYDSFLIKKVNLTYISTVSDGNKIYKLIYGIKSYIKILFVLIFKKIDILHIHMASRNSFNRKSVIVNMGKIFNKKIIIHLHGAEFDKFYNLECSNFQRKKVNKIFEMADMIIALSDQWKEKINKYCNTKIEVLHNAVVTPNINMYNIHSTNISLLGRLEKRKGVYDVLEIAKDIVKENQQIKFLFCGDGDVTEIQKLILKENIEENVNLLGWINYKKKDEVLKDTLIYILPSYDEGMPMSLLEAMSYGIPAIATTVGGIPSVIRNYTNGILIKPGDKENLTKCILNLIKDDKLRKKLSYESYKTIKQEFSINKHIERLISFYNCLVENN